MDKAIELLKKHWGFTSFRSPQEEVIKTVLEKQDTLVILPTGAGKSLCYQLPALMTDGICLVISPLIALMEDQVRSLEAKGIKALMLSSKLNRHETIIAFDNLMYGNYKFLYLSPEKLQSDLIQQKVSQLSLNLIAVDEAHCISQWGHDFRPAYLKIPELLNFNIDIPVIALTATATPEVEKSIVENLQLPNPKVFKSSYIRNNLRLNFKRTEDIHGSVLRMIKSIEEPVIIYVGTRKKSIEYQQFLASNGIKATYYHGGLNYEQKTISYKNWKQEINQVMVATNAFGMGIDKSNVRMIIHTYIPSSVENYMQEIGRAGRDGKEAYTSLIWNESLMHQSKSMLDRSTVSPEYCKHVYTKLNDYYQIIRGELSDQLFQFDLQDFGARYGFNLYELYHALNHLHHENIIFYDQNPAKSSTVKVIEKQSKLFTVQSQSNDQGKILQLLLRSYGGIFDQFTSINERFLSVKSGISKTQVIQALESLDRDAVILFQKASSTLKLKFLVPREDNYVFQNIRKNIEQRNRVKEDKLKAMHQMIRDDQQCRQLQLLSYFDEHLVEVCGKCDICIANEIVKNVDYREVSKNILELLKTDATLGINDIQVALQIDKKHVVKSVELLVEKGFIALNLQNKFYLKV